MTGLLTSTTIQYSVLFSSRPSNWLWDIKAGLVKCLEVIISSRAVIIEMHRWQVSSNWTINQKDMWVAQLCRFVVFIKPTAALVRCRSVLFANSKPLFFSRISISRVTRASSGVECYQQSETLTASCLHLWKVKFFASQVLLHPTPGLSEEQK